MRKRPAAVLLGMFVMVTGTYMAWCALPCLKPMFIYDDNVPEEARQAINEWRKTSTLLNPFPPSYFIVSLCHPFEMKLRSARIEMDVLGRARVNYHINLDIFFEPDTRGNWKGTLYDCFGSQPAN